MLAPRFGTVLALGGFCPAPAPPSCALLAVGSPPGPVVAPQTKLCTEKATQGGEKSHMPSGGGGQGSETGPEGAGDSSQQAPGAGCPHALTLRGFLWQTDRMGGLWDPLEQRGAHGDPSPAGTTQLRAAGPPRFPQAQGWAGLALPLPAHPTPTPKSALRPGRGAPRGRWAPGRWGRGGWARPGSSGSSSRCGRSPAGRTRGAG